MTQHTKDSVCPLCSEKLKGCHPVLIKAYQDLKLEFKDCHISWGFRGQADQELFFKEHKTLAHFPHSKHNTTREGQPYSRAVDLFQINPLGQAIFLPKYYFNMSEFIGDKQLPLEWAGSWTLSKEHFCETDHFQLKEDVV